MVDHDQDHEKHYLSHKVGRKFNLKDFQRFKGSNNVFRDPDPDRDVKITSQSH